MNRVLVGVGLLSMLTVAAVAVIVARHDDLLVANAFCGPVEVGGLSPEAAAKKLRIWWESERKKPIKAKAAGKSVGEFTPGALGVALDDAATVAAVSIPNVMDGLTSGDQPRQDYPLVFRPNGERLDDLAKAVKRALPSASPARISYVNGQIVRKPESPSKALDQDAVYEVAVRAVQDATEVDLPLKIGPKSIPDDVLAQVTDVVSEYTTRFSAGNRPRASNIRLASEVIDGTVLAPGETFSFNGRVGRRTTKRGFREAGVYVNGRHDTGVGGGICQVSTTLYNAALFGNLGIVKRSNHSLPVPYVPLGRDATVSYAEPDLIVRNTYETPIALDAEYRPGRLTFRVLGKKVPGQYVKIMAGKARSWDRGTRVVVDRSLAPGTRTVVDKGGRAHSVSSTRLVYQNGQVVKREPLGQSYYGGSPRLIAVGRARPIPRQTSQTDSATTVSAPG